MKQCVLCSKKRTKHDETVKADLWNKLTGHHIKAVVHKDCYNKLLVGSASPVELNNVTI